MSWDWEKYWQFVSDNIKEGIVAVITVAIVAWILKKIWEKSRPLVDMWVANKKALQAKLERVEDEKQQAEGRIQRALKAVERIEKEGVLREGNGLWLTKPICQPSEYFKFQHGRCIPIWIFANLKGGVAKTTNASNLAAHYALLGERVLLIDLDYQASASSMGIRDHVRNREGQDARATRLIDGGYESRELVDENWAPTVAKDGMIEVANFRIVPAGHDLAMAENRLMVEWLLEERSDDIRYTLAKLLHNKETQSKFDRVIIDAPPRLTTGCVQALCAATHVIIPTVLDQLSVEALQVFVDQVKLLKSEDVCPHIEFGAVVGYRSGQAMAHVPDAEELIFKTLRDADLDEDLYRSDEMVPHNAHLADSAGLVIAYLRSDKPQETEKVRTIFKNLSKSIEERIGNNDR